ncbi:putative S-adenosyl-L-methionine-dependent methyltransferase [Dillenia turbinata]|uniref:Methyltransferase n=1 Tax=Dillenia turbinata TaxID=194707 RepID=A0AAN8VTH3_9MAGN
MIIEDLGTSNGLCNGEIGKGSSRWLCNGEGLRTYKRRKPNRPTSKTKLMQDERVFVDHNSLSTPDFMLLLEMNRMLRTGGYFAWMAESVLSLAEMKEGNIVIWQKPLNNSCYISHDPNIQPPMCDIDDDPDNVWFAAALKDFEFDAWVMNVVPVSGFNTWLIKYDHGLSGVMHDCPQDLKWNISNIVLEIDRIIRPSDHVYIHDKISVFSELEELAAAVRWWCVAHNTFEEPHANMRILIYYSAAPKCKNWSLAIPIFIYLGRMRYMFPWRRHNCKENTIAEP